MSSFQPKERSRPIEPACQVPLIKPQDIAISCGVVGMGLAAWALPSRTWRSLGRAFAPLVVALSDTGGGSIERIRALIGNHIPGQSARRIQLESFGSFIESNLQRFRMHRPGGWQPRIELHGRNHLDEALARGSGVVLWLSWLQAYSLVAKIALHRHGYAVSHLSHPRHGFGNTEFLIRCLNPICTQVEDRYLRERVTRSQDSALKALRILERRLRANGIVSVTASPRAEQPIQVPFLAGRIPMAPGGAFLSYRTGAALMPLHAVQVETDRFAVTIDPPIQVPNGLSRVEFSEYAARQYARSLEPWVIKFPGQWLAWQDQ